MPDIDYGEILEALNDKVDLSGSWDYPSSNRTQLSISANTETQFTAPADGVFVARCGNTSGWLEIRNENTLVGLAIYAQGYNTIFCPAKKGETVTVMIGGSVDRFHFVYAQKTN